MSAASTNRKITKQLEKDTCHGFQTFDDLKDLNDFFQTDPHDVPGSRLEPAFNKNKPTKQDLSRSQGKRE